MNARYLWIIPLLLLVPGLESSARADDEPIDLDKLISIDLAGAPAVDVYRSFAALLSAEPDLDPELAGEVTIQLTDVSTRTMMNAVCEMLSCEWKLTEDPIRRLSVRMLESLESESAEPPGTLDTTVSLSLENAPVEEVFRSFARIGSWDLVMKKPTVSVELEETPIHEALDEVCSQVGCTWTLDQSSEGGVLRIDWVDCSQSAVAGGSDSEGLLPLRSSESTTAMSTPAATDLFLDLTPERVLAAVEAGGLECNNLCYPLNSFENRVYEVELVDRSRVIAKFYRPGRWNESQILEEHRFLRDLDTAELPVCTVRPFPDGATLKRIDGIYYSLSDRRGGRAPDELDTSLARRFGMLVGRLHNVAAADPGSDRRPLDADQFIREPVTWLTEHGSMPTALMDRYRRTAESIATFADRLFEDTDTHRIHADLHLGNVLLRGNRFHLLDFDDMCSGPPVQDLWLALPGRDPETLRLRQDFLSGYEQFRLFDRSSLRLIEPLRGMRMVRYAVWLARRWHDPAFRAGWPHFGTFEYWEGETRDLEEQLAVITREGDTASIAAELGLGTTADSGEELTNKDYFWDWEGE